MKTKEKLLQQALSHFSEKGYYGTSIQDVADAVSVTKQGLLHHFPSKQKLYAAVLAESAENLLALAQKHNKSTKSAPDKLWHLFQALHQADQQLHDVIVLLLRELLDNPKRANQAKQWFLRPFLDALTDVVETGQKNNEYPDFNALAFVYQLLGMSQYFLISKPTLQQLYSTKAFKAHQLAHMALMRKLIIQGM